jgi:hypothetical protein
MYSVTKLRRKKLRVETLLQGQLGTRYESAGVSHKDTHTEPI